MNYNDKWNGIGHIGMMDSEELSEAIKKVESGSKSEKCMSAVIEAARRFLPTEAVAFFYNEEDGEFFCGRLKELHCPTCGKKVSYGIKRIARTEPCTRCGQMVFVRQETLDKR